MRCLFCGAVSMDKLRDDLERIRASAVKRGLSEAEIEEVLAERSSAIAKIEFERKRLAQHLFGLQCFTIAAISAPVLLFIGKIVASVCKVDIELRDEWIIGIWALSIASGINAGYQLVKLDDYLPWLRKPEVMIDFTPEENEDES